MFEYIQPGDTVTRMLAGVIPIKLKVTHVTQDYILCDTPCGTDCWTFDRKTGAEVDPELGWGPEGNWKLSCKGRKGEAMKLSEAILEGSKTTKQCYGGLYSTFVMGAGHKIIATCALGAALLGASKAFAVPPISLRPWLGSIRLHPANIGPRMAADIIINLNDTYEWTRERIAAWVATVEPPEVIELLQDELLEQETESEELVCV